MNTFRKITLTALAVITAFVSSARADIASGSYNMGFEGGASLWDISGSYSEDVDGMLMDYTISVDPSGKITGGGSMSFEEDLGDLSSVNFTWSGTVKTSGAVTRVDLKMSIANSGMIEGNRYTLKMSINMRTNINPNTRSMDGVVSGKVSVSVRGFRSESFNLEPTPYNEALPEDMDGSWDLVINASPIGTKIGGTGQIVLSNGSTYNFSMSGSYNASRDLSRIALKGGPTNKAMSVSLDAVCTGPVITPRTLKGKALGQTLKLAVN